MAAREDERVHEYVCLDLQHGSLDYSDVVSMVPSRGYRMVTVAGDVQAMKSGLAAELAQARGATGSAGTSMY